MWSGSVCQAVNCDNREFNNKISYFRFPKDKDRCLKWVANCKGEHLYKLTTEQLNKSMRLCSEHFEDSQFNNPARKNRLVWNAVPTLFNIPNAPKKVTPRRILPKRLPMAPSPCTSNQALIELPHAVP